MIYLLVFIYLFMCSLIFDINRVKFNSRRLFLFVGYVILIVMAGIRYRLAPDSVFYQYYFENFVPEFLDLSWNYFSISRYQPMWEIIQSIFKSIGGYVFFQFSITA